MFARIKIKTIKHGKSMLSKDSEHFAILDINRENPMVQDLKYSGCFVSLDKESFETLETISFEEAFNKKCRDTAFEKYLYKIKHQYRAKPS